MHALAARPPPLARLLPSRPRGRAAVRVAAATVEVSEKKEKRRQRAHGRTPAALPASRPACPAHPHPPPTLTRPPCTPTFTQSPLNFDHLLIPIIEATPGGLGDGSKGALAAAGALRPGAVTVLIIDAGADPPAPESAAARMEAINAFLTQSGVDAAGVTFLERALADEPGGNAAAGTTAGTDPATAVTSPMTATMRLAWSGVSHGVQFAVEDNGIGIPASVTLETLCRPFAQVRPPSATERGRNVCPLTDRS